MKKLPPWRATIMWYFSVLIFGGFAATVFPTIPFICIYWKLYGLTVPPAPITLRFLQLSQTIIISTAGGYFALRYFHNRFDVTYNQIRKQMKILAAGVPSSCVLIVFLISIPKYGITTPLIINSLVIFGSFSILFISGCFYFAKKL